MDHSNRQGQGPVFEISKVGQTPQPSSNLFFLALLSLLSLSMLSSLLAYSGFLELV